MGQNGKVDLTLSESWPEARRSPQENLLRDNPIIPENLADPAASFQKAAHVLKTAPSLRFTVAVLGPSSITLVETPVSVQPNGSRPARREI